AHPLLGVSQAHPLLAHPLLAHPLLAHPLLAHPLLAHPLLAHPLLAHPLLNNQENQADGDETMDIGDTILKMNMGSTDFLMEGDMLIPRQRTAMKCYSNAFSCLWSKSDDGKVRIPFLINEKYNSEEVETIEKALMDFHSKTCIRFIPRQNERMYIDFEPRYGCFSSLGRIGDRQVISLQKQGCVQHGIIQHEVLHALGFYHEHTRSDRDQHILIHKDNIKNHYMSNFRKMDTNNLGTPYDYTSVMHYGSTAFSTVYRQKTMTPIPDASVPIGQRDGLSQIDILRINRLYKCSSQCN
ncbi:hypothetical protein NHX12_025769, partial [Muraenolepis orangiensis]